MPGSFTLCCALAMVACRKASTNSGFTWTRTCTINMLPSYNDATVRRRAAVSPEPVRWWVEVTSMKAEDYTERQVEVDPWQVQLTSYKLGDVYHCKADRNSTRL